MIFYAYMPRILSTTNVLVVFEVITVNVVELVLLVVITVNYRYLCRDLSFYMLRFLYRIPSLKVVDYFYRNYRYLTTAAREVITVNFGNGW